MSDEQNVNGQTPQDDGAKNTQDNAGQAGPAKQKYTEGTRGKFLVIPAHPNTTFDDAEFLKLLEGSLSLSVEEKIRVADAIPRLSQQQIDDLIRIFNEEQEKFAELAKEAGDKVQELRDRRSRELDQAKSVEEEGAEEENDMEEAERLKREMGL